MNKQIIINIAAFTAGAAISFFVTRKLIEDSYAEMANEEIAEVKAYYREKLYGPSPDKEGADDKKKVKPGQSKSSIKTDWAHKTNNQKTRYDMMYENDGEDPIELAAAKSADMTAVEKDEPYMIDPEEYDNPDMQHYEKKDIYYYLVDGIFADEYDIIMEDPTLLFGDDLIDDLSKMSPPSTTYIRNEPLGMDFEVVTLNQSYEGMITDNTFIKDEDSPHKTGKSRYSANERE